MNIFEIVYNFQDKTEKRIQRNTARNTARLKRLTSGRRWRPIKIIAAIITAVLALALVFSYWFILVILFGLAVIFGLAAKS